jgi:subtilisin-like proprotein convertase family protein
VIGCFTLEVVRQSYVCCGLAGAPLVRNGATTLVAENCPANNNAIDPNEQVTVNFTFTNAGTGSTDNLTATLQSSGGVIPITTTQSYGAIPAGGAATRPFTLAATSTCGGTITATFQLQDGASNLGVFNFAFALGTPTTTNFGPFANPADIVIPAFGAAALYPSNITVAGVTGTVSKVTVRLANLYHTFPDDVDILLVGPTGQKFILMADAGGSADANGPLTFDDAAVLSLPDSGGLPSGVYRPTDHLDSDAFPPPAPAAPYLSPAPTGTATLASTFNGLDPNGAWSLYVTDDTGGDEGIVIGGWSLNIATTASSCCVPPPFRPAPQSSLVLSDPLVCAGPGRVVNGSLQLVNPGTTATNGSLTTTLPPQLLALANTCTANFGACTSNATTIFWSGTIPAGQTLNINYAAQVTDAALAGAEICAVTTANFPPAAPVSVQPCLTINCPAIGPGATHPAAAEASDQRSGAALVYNLYTSNAAAPNAQNTRFSITNTEPSRAAAVHLFFVDGQTCSVADAFVCLTPNQTSSFLASDLDPGTTGYLIAIASDLLTGCPINFNYLIGEAYVKLASGHAANLGAEAIAALAGSPPNCQAFATTAQLNFDGVSYNRVPRVLALSNIPARRDGNDTLLVLNRFGGNLARSAGTLSDIFGIVYDDAENAISFSFSPGVCQFRAVLSNSFPRITPRLENFIPAGRSGWARLYSLSDIGIFGATLNFNANARIASGAFNQGRNLHKLTLTATQTLIIPIFPPGC